MTTLTRQLSDWFSRPHEEGRGEFDIYFEPNSDGGSNESLLDEMDDLITEASWGDETNDYE